MDRSYTAGTKDYSRLLTLSKIPDANFSAAANNEIHKSGSPTDHGYSPKTTLAKRDTLSPTIRSPSPNSKTRKLIPPKLKAVEIENALEELKMLTPTTSSMLRSVVVQVGEKSLESYNQLMKRRKRLLGMNQMTGDPELCSRGRVPCARSGHSADIYKNYMIIFGGDRGQMALNDIYIYELN